MRAMSNQQSISIPSYNPSDIQDRAGFLKFFGSKLSSKIQKVIPAQVVSYDRATNRAVVKILALDITSTGEKLEMKPFPNIPVLMLSGGGFTFSFPVKENQTGWLIAADRDISVFKSLLSVFTPASYRQHQYEDGFFIPDKVNGFQIAESEADAVILTSLDGATKITLQDGQAVITAASVVINGNLTVDGTITASGDVTGANISLSTHTHGGVQTGGGSTGTPQ